MIKLTKKQASIVKSEFWAMYDDKSFPVFDTDKHVDIFEFYLGFINCNNQVYIDYIKRCL